MKYYQELLELKSFTKNDLMKVVGNEKTTEGLITRYIKKGYIKRVKHNFYVVMDIVRMMPLLNKYQIVCSLNDSNYISYHGALEYYALNNQVINEIIYCSDKQVRDFYFDYINYHSVINDCPLQINDIDGVRVTTLERTIVDCIDRQDLAGGIEEIYRAINWVDYLDEDLLIEILDCYGKKTLYQRVGYVLAEFKENLNISNQTLNYIHSKIENSKCYLVPSEIKRENTFDNRWNICVPKYLPSILLKGGANIEI